MSAIENDGEILESSSNKKEEVSVHNGQKAEDKHISDSMEKMRSTWTTRQLLNSNRGHPAWRELRRIMRETSDQLSVSSVTAKNYEKAVTLIMEKFAALKKDVSNEAVRQKVGRDMINCYIKRMGYRRRTDGKQEVAAPKMATGSGRTGWTAFQLLGGKRAGNPAWDALRSALREKSEKYGIIYRNSEHYNKAITEAMKQFEPLKPLLADEAVRSRLGSIMVVNAQKRYHAKMGRAKWTNQRTATKGASNRVTLTSNKLRMVPARSKPVILSRNKAAKKGYYQKTRKNSKAVTAEDDSSSAGSSMEEKPEQEDDSEQKKKPVPQCHETVGLYRLLSADAQDLIFHHQPEQSWKRLQKMLRLTSDSLGLIGLKQKSSYDAIEQIMGSFPVLAPYVGNEEIVEKFRYRMQRQLQSRISADRRSLEAMCEDGQEGSSAAKNLVSLGKTIATPIVKRTEGPIVKKGSNSSKQPTSPKKAQEENRTKSPTMPCIGYPHKRWTRREILSREASDRRPPRIHFLEVEQYMSEKYNVVFRRDKHFQTAVTEIMNHFAALKPLVHVYKYRNLVGQRMLKNRQLREMRIKAREKVMSKADDQPPATQATIESQEVKTEKKKAVGANQWRVADERWEAVGSRKRKREQSQLVEDETRVSTTPGKSKKTIQGYLTFQKKLGGSSSEAEESLEETVSPTNPPKKRRCLQENVSRKKAAEVDLDSSRESISSDKSGQGKAGSKKTIEDYLVVRKRMSGSGNISKSPGKGGISTDDNPGIDNDLKDGCSIHFNDEDDDAFESPPPKSVSGKASSVAGTEVNDARKVGSETKIRKKVPLSKKKSSSLVVNVKSLCSKELNTSDDLEDTTTNDVQILSDWLSTEDAGSSDDKDSQKQPAHRKGKDQKNNGEQRRGSEKRPEDQVKDYKKNVNTKCIDQISDDDDGSVDSSEQEENTDEQKGQEPSSDEGMEMTSESELSDVLLLETQEAKDAGSPINLEKTCEGKNESSDEHVSLDVMEKKLRGKKKVKCHQSFWGPKDHRMAGNNNLEEEVIEIADSSDEVLEISNLSADEKLTPGRLAGSNDSGKGPGVPVISAQMEVERPVAEKQQKIHKKGGAPKSVKERKNKKPEIFEVDTILKYAKDSEGGDWYYVKWLGYSADQNTWEPKEHLSGCRKLLKVFHRQLKRAKLSHRKRKFGDHDEDDELIVQSKKPKWSKQPTSPISTEALRSVVREELKNWAISLNYICTDTAPIVIENDVDFEGPPSDFTYINDYVAGAGVTIPNDPLVGCSCTRCTEEEPECCPQNSGVKFAYNRLKHIRVKPGTPIYECNKYCKCGEDCPNRVVQLGRQYPMSIFRTSNNRGWGVKTLVDIRRNTFVMEYVGEVITSEEAERRGKEYDANGRTYLFDLDYNDDDCPFTVDAGKSGNISHFVNHSCEPNLVVYGVWVNCVDPRLPRIALFASRDIKAGEELTFDYQMTGEVGEQIPSDTTVQQVPCRCGTESCRGFLV